MIERININIGLIGTAIVVVWMIGVLLIFSGFSLRVFSICEPFRKSNSEGSAATAHLHFER